MRPRGLPVRSRGAQLGLSAQCTMGRQHLTPTRGLSSECAQPLPGPLLCGAGRALSLWAALSSPVKWESSPPGVDVKTARLVCEERASRGSLGLQPALFSGLASCLWHGFGFWAVDKGFPPSSSLLRPSSLPLLLPPLSSACPGLSTSLCPHSPPDGIGGVDFNCRPHSVLTTQSSVSVCPHTAGPLTHFTYTSPCPWLPLWFSLVNTTLFYVSTCFCLVWFIHLLCFCWFVFSFHIGVKSYGICFSLSISLSVSSRSTMCCKWQDFIFLMAE